MKRRILIVDDEREFSSMLKLGLEMGGRYEVCEENSAQRAIETARRFAPEVIVLDVMMPEMDGAELAANIRADPTLHSVPVIFLTALVGKEDAPTGSFASGGQVFLPKPVDLDQLVDCIEAKAAARDAAAAAD